MIAAREQRRARPPVTWAIPSQQSTVIKSANTEQTSRRLTVSPHRIVSVTLLHFTTATAISGPRMTPPASQIFPRREAITPTMEDPANLGDVSFGKRRHL